MIKFFKIAILNNIRRKSRTILSLLGIIVGIASLIILVSVVDGVYKQSADTLGKIQGLIVFNKESFSPIFGTLSKDYESKLSSINGVSSVVPEWIHLIGRIDNKLIEFKGPTNSPVLSGIYPEDLRKSNKAIIYDNLIKGKLLSQNDNKMVLISSDFAKKYNKMVGSSIKVDDVYFTVKGIFDAKSNNLNQIILTNPKDIIDTYNLSFDRVNDYTVMPINIADTSKVKKKIEFKFPNLKAMGQQELMQQIEDVLDNLRLLVILVSIISAIIAGVGVINTMLMSVIDRIKEIGTLKAVGWTKSDIVFMILIESTIIGIIGGIFGIIVGIIGSYILNNIATIPTYISITLVIKSFLFAFILGIIGGIYPAIVASNQDPVEALRGV